MKISRKFKIYVVFGVLFVILIYFFLGLKPMLLKTSEINTYLFGDRLITAKNIPYSYNGIAFNNGYSLIFPKYYSLPKVFTQDKDVENIFLELLELPYDINQLDPNKIWEEGGGCQAFSIYLRTAFTKLGLECGYFPSQEHVCLWLIYKNMLWRVDVVTKEFARVSIRDRLYLEGFIPLEGVE